MQVSGLDCHLTQGEKSHEVEELSNKMKAEKRRDARLGLGPKAPQHLEVEDICRNQHNRKRGKVPS